VSFVQPEQTKEVKVLAVVVVVVVVVVRWTWIDDEDGATGASEDEKGKKPN
jgi:hypothetical protein